MSASTGYQIRRKFMVVSNSTLTEMKAKNISIPEYKRGDLTPAIAHIGLGHFHRSHFLTYIDELLRNGYYHNGIYEIDIIPVSETFIDELRKQDYLYSVLSLSPEGLKELRINGPIVGYSNQTIEPETVSAILSDKQIKLITLTITEKGYCYRDDINSLDWDNPGIQHDLETNGHAVTAIGCIADALSIRAKMNYPVTIMSCDNVPENGIMLRKCVMQFCEKKYPDIIKWLNENTSFPCTMVDRITPNTSDEDRKALEEQYGITDNCPVHCESFMQWIIEDDFCTPVPDFAKSGALIVKDVKPYELMKIRLLNGSHSALSYPAYMLGYTMVDKAISDSDIRKFIRNHYMNEIAATLPNVPGVCISQYANELIERFSNPYIADKVLRLASDGSKKISNAILRPLEEGIAKRLNMNAVILALSLWEYYFEHLDEKGNKMPIDDPKSRDLVAVADNPSEFLRIAGLSEECLNDKNLIVEIKRNLSSLKEKGIRKVLEDFLAKS